MVVKQAKSKGGINKKTTHWAGNGHDIRTPIWSRLNPHFRPIRFPQDERMSGWPDEGFKPDLVFMCKRYTIIGKRMTMNNYQKAGRRRVSAALALLTAFGVSLATMASGAPLNPQDELRALDGEWIYVEDRTEGHTLEQMGPPMSSKFSFRIEEGAMLALSRTVSRGKMTAFEFLRIVERDSGLLYVAQPGGVPPTEYVLTEVDSTRAVFDNPRHDYPKRIVYELTPQGGLRATIGFLMGGTPRRFEFRREDG